MYLSLSIFKTTSPCNLGSDSASYDGRHSRRMNVLASLAVCQSITRHHGGMGRIGLAIHPQRVMGQQRCTGRRRRQQRRRLWLTNGTHPSSMLAGKPLALLQPGSRAIAASSGCHRECGCMVVYRISISLRRTISTKRRRLHSQGLELIMARYKSKFGTGVGLWQIICSVG